MRGYLIDAAKQEVREVEWEYTGGRSIAALIGTGVSAICIALKWQTGDVLYVDDEGILKPQSVYFTVVDRADHQPLGGNGLVTGPDNMEETDPPVMSMADLVAKIQWSSRKDFESWAKDRGAAITVSYPDGEQKVLATWDDIIEKSGPPSGASG